MDLVTAEYSCQMEGCQANGEPGTWAQSKLWYHRGTVTWPSHVVIYEVTEPPGVWPSNTHSTPDFLIEVQHVPAGTVAKARNPFTLN